MSAASELRSARSVAREPEGHRPRALLRAYRLLLDAAGLSLTYSAERRRQDAELAEEIALEFYARARAARISATDAALRGTERA